MSKRSGFNALILVTLIGAGGGVMYALSRHGDNELFTAGAPQQSVVALWAVMDLLMVLIGVVVALVLTVAWHGLAQPERAVPIAKTPDPSA